MANNPIISPILADSSLVRKPVRIVRRGEWEIRIVGDVLPGAAADAKRVVAVGRRIRPVLHQHGKAETMRIPILIVPGQSLPAITIRVHGRGAPSTCAGCGRVAEEPAVVEHYYPIDGGAVGYVGLAECAPCAARQS